MAAKKKAEESAPQVLQVVVFGRLHDMLIALGAIPVHNHIMGYAGNPERELTRVGILAMLQLGNHLDKCFLKDVIGCVVVANHKHDVGKQLFLRTV